MKKAREKKRGERKSPQDKETGTIWATGRKCHCLEFRPWGKQAMEGQASGPAGVEDLRLAKTGWSPGLIIYLALMS